MKCKPSTAGEADCPAKKRSKKISRAAAYIVTVRDSSAVRQLFLPTCWSRGTSESSAYGKQQICRCNSASKHFHISWLSDFIFYPKPLYKSLHQSFFYSFITVLPLWCILPAEPLSHDLQIENFTLSQLVDSYVWNEIYK